MKATKSIGIYILRGITLLLAVAVFSFFLAQISPVDPVRQYIQANPGVSAENVEAMKEYWGLNDPPIERFFKWFSAVLHGDWGYSTKAALCAMLAKLDETLVRLERFHDAYQAQWMQENKPHGFDVQDIRLGGLMQRVKTCRARLEDYCAGRLDRLEELEAAQLDFFDHGKRCAEPVATHWGQIATANIVYMTMLW